MPELLMYSAKSYDRDGFDAANRSGDRALDAESVDVESVDVEYVDARLSMQTVGLAAGVPAVCVFVNDDVSAPVVEALAAGGTQCIALRCAGFNNVDLDAAARHGLVVVRVPAYSPNAVAEHTLALILALNRRIHRAYGRVRDGNFSLEGLVGFDLAGKTVGVIGTGKIGSIVARLMWHLRCRVLAVDAYPNEGLIELGVDYVTRDEALAASDVLSLNCPLTPETHHLINPATIELMKPGVMVVNTGRGALIDTAAAIDGLKSGRIGSLALDVYEEEGELFFEDRSTDVIHDDVFARLVTFPNVLITAHQAFLTDEALAAIAQTTLANVRAVLAGAECENVVEA